MEINSKLLDISQQASLQAFIAESKSSKELCTIKDPKNHPWNNHTKRFSLWILILLGQC